MGQGFPLDRGRRALYYLLVAIGLFGLAGCAGRLRSIAPDNLAPLEPAVAAQWAGELAPDRPLRLNLRWRFMNQQGSSAGRAVVRYAPPDTLRFDYRGPFGKSGSAVVVGDRALWAQPEQDFRNLIPAAALFWAALGIPGAPPRGATVLGMDGAERRAWRYVVGEDEMDFILVRVPATRLLAEWRVAHRIQGVSELDLDPETGQPISALMTFPRDAARFSFTFDGIDTVAAFAPDTWTRS